MSLTFVTPTFEPERLLMRLQARSIGVCVKPADVSDIIVIDNYRTGMPKRERTALLREYGPLAGRVRFVSVADAADVGWVSQQVQKLAIADSVSTRHYVALDAKNHLTRPLDVGFFVSPDGRARLSAYRYDDHPLRPRLETAIAYLGLPDTVLDERFPATVTPYVFDTDAVRGLIKAVELDSGKPFGVEFADQGLTEFFLYAGYLVRSGGLDAVHTLDRVPSPSLWPSNPTLAAVQQLGEPSESPWLSTHRNAIRRLDRKGMSALGATWHRSGLADSARAGMIWGYRVAGDVQRHRVLSKVATART